MSVYCDEEFDIHLMEAGCRARRKGPPSDAEMCSFLPDDVVSILADYSCEYLSDQLTFSLLSSQHQRVMQQKLRSLAYSAEFTPQMSFQLANFAEYFTNWSIIRFGGEPAFVTEVESSKSALSFYCKSCHELIITQNEVESPHYHGGYGPAFLAHRVFNCHHSAEEAYETQFTTGVYKVCEVSCLKCGSRVGKKYIEARDPANFFKVGKILLEQTLLTMPKCCNNRKLNAFPPEHYFCSRESGVSCFCSVCFDAVRTGAAFATLEMTRHLEIKETMKLLSLLLAERQILTNNDSENMRTLMASVTSAVNDPSSPSFSRRFGDVISRFVRRSISSSGPPGTPSNSLSPNNSSSDLLELGSPTNAAMNSTYIPSSSTVPKLNNDQLAFLSQSVGSRIAMIPDCQNWIMSTKFVSDIVTIASKQGLMMSNSSIQLNKLAILEALLSQCGPVTFHSVTLLLSRAQNADDRKAVVAGISKNPRNVLSPHEIEGLFGITGASPGRWSFAPAGGHSQASSHR